MHGALDRTMFLRRSLQLDGLASGLCGIALLVAASPVSRLIGLAYPTVAMVVGAGLVLFAAALFWNARRATISRVEAVGAVVLNGAWVLGSIVLIAGGPLTLLGNVVVAAVAAAVLAFAVLESIGLWQLSEA